MHMLLFLNKTPIFDQHTRLREDQRNNHHNDTCSKTIELCLHILSTTPHSIVNTTKKTNHVLSKGINKHALLTTIIKVAQEFQLSIRFLLVFQLIQHKLQNVNSDQ